MRHVSQIAELMLSREADVACQQELAFDFDVTGH